MSKISLKVQNIEEIARLKAAGLVLLSQGKVREIYALPDHSDLLLMVVSNRLSIFDFVLSALVPQKGEVLTALTIFWLDDCLTNFPSHLNTYGWMIDAYLPVSLADDTDLQKRAVVVDKLEMLPVEAIVRGYLTGSGWKDYRNNSGVVCGHQLPEGLHDGSKLEIPLFTPSTKEDDGHDENISAVQVREKYGLALEEMAIATYRQANERANAFGIIIADTKFEFGFNEDGKLCIGDEVLTPDSSRFWDADEWAEAAEEGKSPSGYDKEPVRQWGKTVTTPWGVGLHNLNPSDPKHLAFVAGLKVPEEVISATTERYCEIFRRLTGQTLEEFQHGYMGVV